MKKEKKNNAISKVPLKNKHFLYAVEKAIEEKNKKADLSQRVIFKRKKEVNDDKTASDTANPKEVKKKKKSKSTKSVLSFNDEDEEEE